MSRASSALQRVIRRAQRSSLVVAHGGILNAAMYCILGIPPPPRGPRTSGVHFVFGDACFVRTSYDPGQHVWSIREMAAQAG